MTRCIWMLAFALLGTAACDGGEFGLGNTEDVLDARPDIVVDRGSVAFAPAVAGQVQTEPVLISNLGDALLHIDEVVVQGGSFVLSSPAPTSLEPGASAEVSVTRTPLNPEDVGWLQIYSDDPDEPEVTVDLTGETLMPQIVMSPDVLSFGPVQVGDESTLFATVTNIGEAPGVFEAIEQHDVFLWNPPPLPMTLTAGQSVQVAVRFTPEVSRLYGDVVRPAGDGAQLAPAVQVKGRGYVVGIGSGGIIGRVCDPSGNGWVTGATVWIDDGGIIVSTVTDEDGYFQLDGLTAGFHTIHIEKGSWGTTYDIEVYEGAASALPDDLCLTDEGITVGVVSGLYDSVEVLLTELGIDYEFVEPAVLLADPSELERFDVLFFNCSEGTYAMTPVTSANLADWVSNGGTAYASDYAFWVVENTWPGAIEFAGDDEERYGPATGAAGTVYVDLVDPGMQAAVGGPVAQVRYDLGAWMQIQAPQTMSATVEGNPPPGSVHSSWQAFAADQQYGGGRIIYTTFHNEAQATGDMRKILHEMILSL